jgi:DNA polymerase-3 subunit alpha
MPVTQFSMKDAEYLGLVKFDFLGLKTLSVVRAAEDMVKARHDPTFDITKIDLADHATFEMLKQGITLGVFQIEGGGITELTKKMQADDMESLSAILALYRPGPLGTGMVDDYVNCKLGKAEAKYPHEILKPALEVTFGVPVYQEQIMQMARDMAGYTLGGADMLRRAMGKKKPEEMAKERSKFTKGAAELHQIPEDESNHVFDLMAGFAEYGFNKAHTIAYALISFQTAYLKAHYPQEFMAATMTYDRGNHEKLLRLKLELQKLGYATLVPDVNQSGVMFTVEGPCTLQPTAKGGVDGKAAVRHALSALKGAGEEAMRQLVANRKEKGPFKNIWDLLDRLGPQVMNKRQLEVLAKGGAFDSLNTDKNPLWRSWLVTNVDTLVAYAQDAAEARASGQGSLFGGGNEGLDSAAYQASCKPAEVWDYMTTLQYEAESVGFYLSSHPLNAFEKELARVGNLRDIITVESFAAGGGGACRLAGLVNGIREVKTKTGNRMGIVTLSDPTGQCEVVFFPEAYANTHTILESGEPLVVNVRISIDGERLRVSADSVRTLAAVLGERPEMVISLPSAALVPQVKNVLDSAQKGPTMVKLIVPSPQGKAILRLPQRLGISPIMLANLKGLGVEIS